MKHIARSTLVIALLFGLDKILALLRQLLTARMFGLTYEIDAFNAANNIPDLLSALISGGALSVAIIPILSEYLKKRGRPDTWKIFSRVLNLAFITTGILAIIIWIIAPILIDKVIAPGFPIEQKNLSSELMRLDLIAIIIFSISGLVMAGLQANQHFVLPAIAPAFYNLGQIFGLLILSPITPFTILGITLPTLRLGIHGLVYGVIMGAFLHLLIQIPGLRKYKFEWYPLFNLKDAELYRVLKLVGPRIATMLFIQVFFITRDNIASGLGEGAVTALNYGWFIMQVPETLIGSAFAIVILPTLAELYATGNKEEYKRVFNLSFRFLIALTVPISVIIALNLQPFVSILGFDNAGIIMVTQAAQVYLIGLTGHTILELTSRGFYARHDAKTPLFAAFINALIYVALAIGFANLFSQNGIALANSIAFSLEALLLLFLLSKRLPGIANIRSTIIRTSIVSAVIAVITFVVSNKYPPSTSFNVNSILISSRLLLVTFILVLIAQWSDIKPILALSRSNDIEV